MRTREQHIAWAKERALEYVDAGDLANAVASMGSDLNARRLERYLATAWQSGANPVVVLTKSDLSDDPEAEVAEAEGVAFGAPVLAVSAVTGAGLEALGAQALGWEGDDFTDAELVATHGWLRSKGNSIEGGTSEVNINVVSKRVLGLPDPK